MVDEEEDDFIHEIMAHLGVPVKENEEVYLAIEHALSSHAA